MEPQEMALLYMANYVSRLPEMKEDSKLKLPKLPTYPITQLGEKLSQNTILSGLRALCGKKNLLIIPEPV